MGIRNNMHGVGKPEYCSMKWSYHSLTIPPAPQQLPIPMDLVFLISCFIHLRDLYTLIQVFGCLPNKILLSIECPFFAPFSWPLRWKPTYMYILCIHRRLDATGYLLHKEILQCICFIILFTALYSLIN